MNARLSLFLYDYMSYTETLPFFILRNADLRSVGQILYGIVIIYVISNVITY